MVLLKIKDIFSAFSLTKLHLKRLSFYSIPEHAEHFINNTQLKRMTLENHFPQKDGKGTLLYKEPHSDAATISVKDLLEIFRFFFFPPGSLGLYLHLDPDKLSLLKLDVQVVPGSKREATPHLPKLNSPKFKE